MRRPERLRQSSSTTEDASMTKSVCNVLVPLFSLGPDELSCRGPVGIRGEPLEGRQPFVGRREAAVLRQDLDHVRSQAHLARFGAADQDLVHLVGKVPNVEVHQDHGSSMQPCRIEVTS